MISGIYDGYADPNMASAFGSTGGNVSYNPDGTISIGVNTSDYPATTYPPVYNPYGYPAAGGTYGTYPAGGSSVGLGGLGTNNNMVMYLVIAVLIFLALRK